MANPNASRTFPFKKDFIVLPPGSYSKFVFECFHGRQAGAWPKRSCAGTNRPLCAHGTREPCWRCLGLSHFAQRCPACSGSRECQPARLWLKREQTAAPDRLETGRPERKNEQDHFVPRLRWSYQRRPIPAPGRSFRGDSFRDGVPNLVRPGLTRLCV